MEKLNLNKNIEEIIKSNDMVLLYFGRSSCNVCINVKPKIEEFLKKYPKIKAVHIDIENSVSISSSYSIYTIPAIILFVDGKETIREARFINIQDLEVKISRYYNLYY